MYKKNGFHPSLFLILQCFTTIQSVCKYRLTNEQGLITTPNYPKNYPQDLSCVWTITVPKGFYVELTFDDFDVEPYDDCKTDVLEVKDGGSKNSPLVGILDTLSPELRTKGGQYCNLRPPPKVITSTYNQLRLWFSSDPTIQYRGFKATYKAVKDTGCGGEIKGTSGIISSPRFPLHYPRNTNCEWKVEVPKGKFIALEFPYFQLETSCPQEGPCKCNDYVTIKDDSKNGEEIGQYCFAAPSPMVTNGNQLTIAFSSDVFGRLKGFQAVFTQSSTKKCGGDLLPERGIIRTPNFNVRTGSTYPAYSNCVWTIHAKKNSYLSLRFQYLDVIGTLNDKCSSDYVEIRDGKNNDSPLLGRYCNTHQPKVLLSSTESLYIHFVSGSYSSRKGFEIQYQSHTRSCTTSLGMEDGRIEKYDLVTSSNFKIAHWPHVLSGNYARLNGPFAWCSQEQKYNVIGEYIQINFKSHTRISRVATQGYAMVGNVYFVTRYKLMYSVTGEELQYYASKADSDLRNLYTVFEGNKMYNVSRVNDLSPNIAVRSLRIIPLNYQSGRRKHICLRVEIYGCPIQNDVEISTSTEKTLELSTKNQTSKTWLVSPEAKNAVYMLKFIKLHSDCLHSSLSFSYDGLNYQKESCSKSSLTERNKHLRIYSANRQLWVKFDTKSSREFQIIKLHYLVLKLGEGRVITSHHGKIRLMHNVVAEKSDPSVWLFYYPSTFNIRIEFKNIQLPKGKVNPSIVIKSGLEETSQIIGKIEGRKSGWAFVHLKNLLRIEYRTGHGEGDAVIKGQYDDGFTLSYSAYQAK